MEYRNKKDVRIIGIRNIALIKTGDDLGEIIWNAVKKQEDSILDDDVIIVTQKIVSKSEGRVIQLKNVTPSSLSKRIARKTHKNPELVELILTDAKSIVRMRDDHIITETRHGWICANSGVDVSNVSGGDSAALLPLDPDRSAKKIRARIGELSGKNVAVIISDTFGRPFRKGHTDIAIGSSGITPLLDLRGEKDLFGYILQVKQTAIVDELASAAELVMGNATEKIPAVLIRGYPFQQSESLGAKSLIMSRKQNLFY